MKRSVLFQRTELGVGEGDTDGSFQCVGWSGQEDNQQELGDSSCGPMSFC